MEISRLPVMSPEIPLHPDPFKSDFYHSGRIAFFPPMTAVGGSRSDGPNLESRNRMFVLGMGFVGGFFAQELKQAGWAVLGTCRSTSRKREFENRGVGVHLFDANQPKWSMLETMKSYTHLLISIPPLLDIGDPMLNRVEYLRQQLSGGNLQWLCYLSSTSVYGDCGGAWVTEAYPAKPKTQSSKLRLAAEQGWLNMGHDLGVSTQILRLGGIYGPGRSAVDTLVKQEPLSEGQKRRTYRKFTSRVHVEDICQAIRAAIENPSSGRIYNVVDDDPAPREEVFAYALELIEKRWPGHMDQKPSLESSEGTEKESSWRGEKRVCNARMKKELGVKLLHPSYRSGLLSIIEKMDNPFCKALPSTSSFIEEGR